MATDATPTLDPEIAALIGDTTPAQLAADLGILGCYVLTVATAQSVAAYLRGRAIRSQSYAAGIRPRPYRLTAQERADIRHRAECAKWGY